MADSPDTPTSEDAGPAKPAAAAGELRIAIFSDVHGNLAALRAVATALDRVKALNHTVVAGDHLQGGPRPAEVWEALTSRGWILIRGNEDDSLLVDQSISYQGQPQFRAAFLSGIAWARKQVGQAVLDQLAALPDRWRIATPAGDLLVVHSSPRSMTDRAGGVHNTLAEVGAAYGGTGAALIAFGHFHHSFVRPTPFGLLVNVASVGLPQDDRALACYTIITANADGWVVEQRQVPYDPAEEASVAAERGMPAWIPDPEC